MPSANLMTPRSKAPRNLGCQLREWRLEQGMTQSELAARAGLSLKTVQRLERGARPSADSAKRLECALDLPDDLLAPDWDLPPSPVESDYGARVRARRRALGLSQEGVALAAGVSAATLSRFERGITITRSWFIDWRDEYGSRRNAIVATPLAHALGFKDSKELHEFCVVGDVSEWAVAGDRRSGLWLPTEDCEPGVPRSRAFPTSDELRTVTAAKSTRRVDFSPART